VCISGVSGLLFFIYEYVIMDCKALINWENKGFYHA
jgi:hypothetical protein